MVKPYFSYKGKKSTDFGLRIHNDMTTAIPEHDLDFIEIKGKDGELAIDNKRLKSVPKSFSCSIFVPEGKTIDEVSTNISEWLRSDVGWHKLTFTGYEGYEFEAICYETINIEETLRMFGKTVINFKMKPYKYLVGSRNNQTITSGTILTNPTKRNALPLIKITGSGTVTFKNNAKNWLIIAVDGEMTIDTLTQSVFKALSPQFDKMNGSLDPLFPILSPGSNTITWTGGVITKVEVMPRWEVVV